jgi:hypothetical protein
MENCENHHDCVKPWHGAIQARSNACLDFCEFKIPVIFWFHFNAARALRVFDSTRAVRELSLIQSADVWLRMVCGLILIS